MKDFINRIAVVTGAGGGMGRAISLQLAHKGCDLALVDINQQRLQETAKLVTEVGRKASCHVVDVADKTQMAALVEAVINEHKAVHILVNNAGVAVGKPFMEQTVEDLEWITGINYWGVLYGCKFFLPQLLQQDEAHIVNMSSSAGLTGMPLQASYSATKFAVRGFSESLFVDLAKTRVGISCVHPGAVATDILNNSRMDSEQKEKLQVGFNKIAMPAEKAARLIVKAIEKKRFKVIFCVESVFFDFTRRLSAVGILKIMRLVQRLKK
jgi:NADP-dependent 3-hydroxy acid dehydrogenase YdfG